MCGITGILNFDKKKIISQAVLKSMADSIVKRGPDDEGYYINQNIGLAFRRLSIIDLSTGHQPLCNEDGSIWIVFNGEIYNFQELRAFLVTKGHKFSSLTDTEVIVHLYEEYGEDCVTHLRGMFSFVIWDNNKKKLMCARDRFGIKPFYYYYDKKKFVFASEIKAILRANSIDKQVSLKALDSYFAYGYITSDLSIYENIKKLNPGHILIINQEQEPKIEIKSYWNIQYDPDYTKTEDYWAEEIENTLSEAIRLHMISDVPLGAFLSGGIDSSAVVAHMSRHSSVPVKTFSIGFNEEEYSELKYAELIAKRFGTDHHVQIVDSSAINLLSTIVSSYDEPYADVSAIPTYILSKFTRQHVKVVLSGDGGDELFAGYGSHASLSKINQYNFGSPFLNKLIWGNLYKLLPNSVKGKNFCYYLSKNKKYLGAYYSLFNLEERNKLFKKDIIAALENERAEYFKEQIIRSQAETDFLTGLIHLDTKSYMVDDILTKVDRVSMHNSLEVRVPLLDHKFAELTYKIPSTLKLKNGEGKYIFKKSLKNILPNEILNRQKRGFYLPINIWFRTYLKNFIESSMHDSGNSISEYINMDYLRKMIKDNQYGTRDLSHQIWSIVMFNEWLNQHASVRSLKEQVV